VGPPGADIEPPAALEAQWLAEGRELLEHWCLSTRFRYLYPEGPNLALLFSAYQDLDRLRIVGRVRETPSSQRRALRRLIRAHVRRDVRDRVARLHHRPPAPRLEPLPVTPVLVERALASLDPNDRTWVHAHLGAPDLPIGTGGDEVEPRGVGAVGHFRSALYQEALADPRGLLALPPQILWLIASRLPRRRRRPLLVLFLIRLPLQAVLALVTVFNIAYVGAYFFFNDEVLGKFIGQRVSRLLDGDLELRRVHWSGRLIFDLLTGTPHRLLVEDVSVWNPFKSTGGVRTTRTALAPKLEVSLVLHEIIPWNRIGIPRFLEIPWILHFTEVRSLAPVQIDVVEYEEMGPGGEPRRVLSLRDAFQLYNPPNVNAKGLSIAVDDAKIEDLALRIDMSATADWEAAVDFDSAVFDLAFDAPDPSLGAVDLPFSFDVSGHGTRGLLRIADFRLPLRDLDVRRFRSNRGDVAVRNVAFDAALDAVGSAVEVDGTLISVFGRLRDKTASAPMEIELDARSKNADAVAAHVGHSLGLPLGTFVGNESPARASISGSVLDPTYDISATRLTVNVAGEPAWIGTDADVSVSLTNDPLPAPWVGRLPHEVERLVVTLRHLDAGVLGGRARLPVSSTGTVVLPHPGESFLIAIPLELDGVDPAGFVPSQPSLAPLLGGSLQGALDVRSLVIGARPPPHDDSLTVLEADLRLEELALRRHHGPEQDGIPRNISAHGEMTLEPEGNLALRRVRVSTDGTHVDLDGALDLDRAAYQDLDVGIAVTDGAAFARALGLTPYFASAHTQLRLTGAFGAPTSRSSRLVVTDLLDSSRTTEATLRLSQGTLQLEAKDAYLLGGHGSVDARAHLFEHGEIAKSPRLFAALDLHELDLARLPGEAVGGRADIELEIGDGTGNAAPISDLRIMGVANAPSLTMGGTTYQDASVSFQLFSDELAIHHLVLPIHRPVSPFLAGRVTVPVGEVAAEGTITIEDDPNLDLHVTARGVPLEIVGRLLNLDAEVRGQIGEGTALSVRGSVQQPQVDGVVALNGLSAEGIALGGGRLEVTSDDFAAEGPLVGHRELHVRGELATRSRQGGRRRARKPIEWTVDALVAIGAGPDRDRPAVSAQLNILFKRLSIPELFFDQSESAPLDGELLGASAEVVTCSAGAPMISACVDPGAPDGLSIELSLDRAWIRGGSPSDTADEPCNDPATICARSPLIAGLEGSRVELKEPWSLGTGGPQGSTVTIAGVFDLSELPPLGDAGEPSPTEKVCTPPPPDSRSTLSGGPPAHGAKVSGDIDFRVFSGLVPNLGLDKAKGRLELAVEIDGSIRAPRLAGHAELRGEALSFDLDMLPVPLEFKRLAVDIRGDWLHASGTLALGQGALHFGSVEGAHTGYAFGGSCAHHFGVAARGSVGSALLAHALGPVVASDDGGVAVRRVVAQGRAQPEFALHALEGTIGFGDPLRGGESCLHRPARQAGGADVLTLEFTDGVPHMTIDCGDVQFSQCRGTQCEGVSEGWYAVRVGRDPSVREPPREALRAHSGPRGEAWVWGEAFVSPDFDRAEGTTLRVRAKHLPYRAYDGRGRLAYEAEITSDNLMLAGGTPLVATGAVALDRARYVKDAIQGVEILTLTDEVDTEASSAPPPAILEGMRLDVRVDTDRPLRVENNLARGVEAQLSVQVSGSYEAPEFVGRLEVEPGGLVDVPFLTGHYEILRGRVTLLREWENAEVDVVALRQEPVYIDDQPRQIQLLLRGTLSGMQWSCLAEGDTSGELDSLRACTEYLVLGTGDVQISDADVQRFGGGGLANARKPLQVVGHLTEIDVGEEASEAAPRLRRYIPDIRLRLGQIGPELHIATPSQWFDWGWGRAGLAWDYVRGYPGFLLRQSREIGFRLELLESTSIDVRRRRRSYLNNRIVFDPLEQTTLEFSFDFDVPSLR